MSHYCEKCGKMMDDTQFYTSKNIEKYPPDGKMSTCKKCLTMHVDNWDPETYKWILQEIDVPYIKEEWDALLERYGKDPKKITGLTIIGRYLSKMKLKQWNKYTWADTEKLEQRSKQEKTTLMQSQGFTEEEIQQQLSMDRTPPKPKGLDTPQAPVGVPEYIDLDNQEDEFSDQLTEEDKLMLRLKWGRGYSWEQRVRMEQLYNDMMSSYDIQGAGHKDTLIMICKASLKANELIDAGDIDGFQKMQKAYDSLMKSGKFTAAQNKGESGEFIDSIGELVALCEREGFIPRYYTDGPQDKVDRTLQDLQQYTHTLVTEEMNLGNMIEASLREIVKDKEREAHIDVEDSDEDDELFDYEGTEELTDEDYEEYEDMKEQDRDKDEEMLNNILEGVYD